MLKIKEGIDFNELKKYGFVNEVQPNKDVEWVVTVTREDETGLYVYTSDRSIYGELGNYYNPEIPYEFYDVLFDMISDGIIEKIKK